MSTEITVRGSFAAFQPPERGTVHASIGYEGPEMQPVYDRVARDLETVKASVERLMDTAVTWWAADRLRTWSTRPWNSEGEQLPLVHHAAVGIKVKFRDFSALSRWVGEHVENTEGFSTSHVAWALTSKHRDELVEQAHTRAVRDALTRAQRYADALGLGTVRPVAIADPGMLVVSSPHGDGGDIAYLDAVPRSSGAPTVELVPEDIKVSASVDARFVTDAA
jgi:hypothetical protein